MTQSKHPITDEPLDQFLAIYQIPEDLPGVDCTLKQLTKKWGERALGSGTLQ